MKILNILITFANHDENVEYFANDDQPTTRAGKWNPTCTTPQDIFRQCADYDDYDYDADYGDDDNKQPCEHGFQTSDTPVKSSKSKSSSDDDDDDDYGHDGGDDDDDDGCMINVWW